MTALFIGRFQPFHLGHLDAIKKIIKENDRVIIGIGSTTENFQPENPFTCGERIQMIEAAMKETKIPAEKYLIIPVPNIQNYALWPKHVELMLPPFEKIYTGSKIIRELYENYNKNLQKGPKIIEIKKRLNISATSVRQHILENKNLGNSVPKSVAALLKRWGIQERLIKIEN